MQGDVAESVLSLLHHMTERLQKRYFELARISRKWRKLSPVARIEIQERILDIRGYILLVAQVFCKLGHTTLLDNNGGTQKPTSTVLSVSKQQKGMRVRLLIFMPLLLNMQVSNCRCERRFMCNPETETGI